MSIAPPPPKPPPPKTATSSPAPSSGRKFEVKSGALKLAEKVVIYGPGGVGKTKLTTLLKDVGVKPLILDLENGSSKLDCHRIIDITTFDDVRNILHDESLFAGYGAVVIDSFTKAEELVTQWVLRNVRHEKGYEIRGIEDYGFGKGYVHIYETFLHLLSDLDDHARKGRHVIGICHECVTNAPNPSGDDWIRYEPRLQSPAKGTNSIRHRVKEWCEHLLYVGYDVVADDGKARGSGTRTIYPREMPHYWAKSRSLADPIPYQDGSADLWRQLLGK